MLSSPGARGAQAADLGTFTASGSGGSTLTAVVTARPPRFVQPSWLSAQCIRSRPGPLVPPSGLRLGPPCDRLRLLANNA